MGLFNYLGKIFGKAKVRNVGSFHGEDEPFGKYASPGKSAKDKREAKEAMRRLEEYFPGVTEAKRAAQEERGKSELNEVEEDEFARLMEEEAEKKLQGRESGEDRFIYDAEPLFTNNSEHVEWMQYINTEEILYIAYHTNGSIYKYSPISEQEARLYYSLLGSGDTPTLGTTVVWQYLRRRGTAFGHQKDYNLVSGTGPKPKYQSQPHWEAEHGAIPESGVPPESWIAGEGPYGEDVTPFKPHWY